MNKCDTFTKTKKVARCGSTIWLGTATFSSGMMILVTYFLNGDEVSDFFEPIIDGNNVYLDLSEPSSDYYNPFKTYYISLTDTSGYYSDGTQLTNGGTAYDGFIVNFSDAQNGSDRLIVEE